MKSTHLGASLIVLALLSACQSNPSSGGSSNSNNPSPTAGSSSSQSANEMADRGMYKPIEYANVSKKGPKVIVVPGEIKSNNANFMQKFGPNNIADYGELEMSNANFGVLERSDLGSIMSEIQLAYNVGDSKAARRIFQKGKLKTTKWLIRFDVLKAEPVASASSGFDGQAIGSVVGILGNSRNSWAAGTAISSVKTGEATGVWVIGMRYKIIDANTTEQVGQGYNEEKMEIGATSTSVLGFSSSKSGGLTLDSLVQRLVQKSVYDIDRKYK